MSNCIIVYADYKYYSLNYYLTNKMDTKFNLTEIYDESNKLYDILPRSIYSCDAYNSCIIDINNNIHWMTIMGNNDSERYRFNIYCNIGKSKLKHPVIIGCSFAFIEGHHYNDILVRDNSTDNSYEYFRFERISDEIKLQIYNPLQEFQVTHNLTCISVKINNDTNKYFLRKTLHELPNNLKGCQLLNINGDIKRRVLREEQQSEFVGYKYIFNIGITEGFKYSVLVNNDGGCYISLDYENFTKFFTMTNNSVLFVNSRNDDIMVIDGSDIIATTFSKIMRFTLPVEHIYYADNTKVNKYVWSEKLHIKLPNYYNTLIEIVLLCNKMLGYLRIPRGVLSIIFNYFIN